MFTGVLFLLAVELIVIRSIGLYAEKKSTNIYTKNVTIWFDDDAQMETNKLKLQQENIYFTSKCNRVSELQVCQTMEVYWKNTVLEITADLSQLLHILVILKGNSTSLLITRSSAQPGKTDDVISS